MVREGTRIIIIIIYNKLFRILQGGIQFTTTFKKPSADQTATKVQRNSIR